MRPANGRAASSPGTVIGLSADRVNARVFGNPVSAGPCATPCAGAALVALSMLIPRWSLRSRAFASASQGRSPVTGSPRKEHCLGRGKVPGS